MGPSPRFPSIAPETGSQPWCSVTARRSPSCGRRQLQAPCGPLLRVGNLLVEVLDAPAVGIPGWAIEHLAEIARDGTLHLPACRPGRGPGGHPGAGELERWDGRAGTGEEQRQIPEALDVGKAYGAT